MVQTRESELLSSLTSLQCRVMPCITGAAGAQQFRRPVQQELWTCLGCLRACAAGRPPEGAPGGTFGSIPQDWDMISKIRARQSTRLYELSSATAAQTCVGQALDAEVFHLCTAPV